MSIALRYANSKRKTIFTSKDGSVDSSGRLIFHFYPSEFVSGIQPYEGPSRGGTLLTVSGSNFRNTPELAVRFIFSGSSGVPTAEAHNSVNATTTVPARFMSSAELTLEVPRCPLGPGTSGFFSVEVSSNSLDFIPSNDGPLYFYNASEPFVATISPLILREGGGVILTVRGSGFPETYPSTLACVFGDDTVVLAVRYSAELLTCVAPSRRPGQVLIAVTSYGQSLASERDINIEYVGALHIFSSWPEIGPAVGGTAVTILGEGFRVDEVYTCVFGDIQPPVSTIFVNSSSLVCHTPGIPVGHESGEVNLRVLILQGDNTTLDGNYRSEVILAKVLISREVTAKDDLDLNPVSLYFRYYDNVNIFWASPANGPASGGTVVRISGSGFLDLPQTACRFGVGEPTPARVVDAWTLVCKTSSFISAAGISTEVTPQVYSNMSQVDKRVAVRVSINGLDFSPSNTSVFFLYDDDMTVLAIVPDRGPATGGIHVLVHGSAFRQDERLGCRFGMQVVPAEYLRADIISCLVPPQVRLSVVSISVTLNGQDFVAGKGLPMPAGEVYQYMLGPLFTYTDRASVIALQPNRGPSRGGTRVRVSGVNFADTSIVLCNFGTVKTVAIFVSTEAITCASPAMPVGTGRVYLEVSDHSIGNSSSRNNPSLQFSANPGNDPMVWTNNGVEFTFTDDAEVLAVLPSSGPSSGGTLASLIGSGFEDLWELGCRFGGIQIGVIGNDLGLTVAEAFEKTAADTPAMYVSPTEIMCIVPEQSRTLNLDRTTAGGTVRVAATLNGQDYGLKMAEFTYYPTPEVNAVLVASTAYKE